MNEAKGAPSRPTRWSLAQSSLAGGASAELTGRRVASYPGDLTDAEFTTRMIAEFRPDTIVHFAEQRSAPYSVIEQKHAVNPEVNNIVGTMNVLYAIADVDLDIHLVKLGTMGEYGTPNIDIEEGWLEVTRCSGTSTACRSPHRAGPGAPSS